ncbi:MAG: DUF1501 domain-containing protein [Verrucomicrobiales bacterium]|nr:DUF1501 domain-containing protein [Verrucomicrobiales bacterium]
MKNIDRNTPNFSRRSALQTAACGFGSLAFSGLFAEQQSVNPLIPRQPHFSARAKRVIFLFMRGGPSQVDTFDFKPELSKRHNEDLGGGRKYYQSPWQFKRYGECGLPVSELFHHTAKHADDLCVINSMHTDIANHPQAILQMNTGSFQFVRPSVGSWVVYGLGTENQSLPGFITINPDFSAGGARKYGCAFLPSSTAGTPINQWGGGDGKGAPTLKDYTIPYTTNETISKSEQRSQLDLLQTLNRAKLKQDQINETLEGVIQSYETAFRMQAEMPGLIDVEKEPGYIIDRYGINTEITDNFGRACLMARRFVEKGVRFVQLNLGFWDQHKDLVPGHEKLAFASDKPISALLTDLKERGLLEDTLVLWGGEFGRPPILNKNKGRDHNAAGFTMWMAGGGVKCGLRYGQTDPTGQTAVSEKVHLHDLHATLLHLLGLNHEQLTYRYGGRDFRLTDVYGNVVHDIIA